MENIIIETLQIIIQLIQSEYFKYTIIIFMLISIIKIIKYIVGINK